MVFVNELIPESEKKAIPFEMFKPSRIVNIDGKSFKKWTIDRERDCYFIKVKSYGPECQVHYGGCWKGQLFKFRAMPTRSKTLDDKYNLNWKIRVTEISYPLEACETNTRSENEKFRVELLKLLVEGLMVHGDYYNNDAYDVVTVDAGEVK